MGKVFSEEVFESLGCIKIGMFFQKVIRLIVGKDGWMGCTDYGRPMKPFFIKILGQSNWADKF